METVKERLLEFLKCERISQIEFTRSIGVSGTYVATLRKSMSPEKLKRVMEVYPQLNREWLLYGEGDMYNQTEDEALKGMTTVPVLPLSAFAGNLQEWSRGVSESECSRIVSPVKDADFAIPISGDSMEPDFPDGSTLLIKRINDRAFIPWGNPLVLDTENGVVIKDIFPSEENMDVIMAVSRNHKYPPYEIPKSSIFGIYRVLCTLKPYPTL